jgi:hypothetical protein
MRLFQFSNRKQGDVEKKYTMYEAKMDLLAMLGGPIAGRIQKLDNSGFVVDWAITSNLVDRLLVHSPHPLGLEGDPPVRQSQRQFFGLPAHNAASVAGPRPPVDLRSL